MKFVAYLLLFRVFFFSSNVSHDFMFALFVRNAFKTYCSLKTVKTILCFSLEVLCFQKI